MPSALDICGKNPNLREFRNFTVSCSSTNPKYHVSALTDNDPTTCWQSSADGRESLISIKLRFSRAISPTGLLVDVRYNADKSFTPLSTGVYAGFDEANCVRVGTLLTYKQTGWVYFELPEMTFKYLQLRIESNHCVGKDSRVHGVKLFVVKPREPKWGVNQIRG